MWISCLILVLAAGVYALWPLFAKRLGESAASVERQADSSAETDEDYLTARKTAIYRNIKELEFEYKMGRLAEPDFRRLESEYKSEAAEILYRLDMLNAAPIPIPPPESEIDDVCPTCGAKTIPGKKFCADCGARL